jgi:hypothetical protein
MGGLTRNAINRAREMGYEVNERTGEIRKLNRKGLAQRMTEATHKIAKTIRNAKESVKSPKI